MQKYIIRIVEYQIIIKFGNTILIRKHSIFEYFYLV